MIVRLSHIYKIVSEKLDIPMEVVESVGLSVFSSLRANLSYPEDISYEVRGLGVFNLKHTKFKEMVDNLDMALENGRYALDTEEKIKDCERKKRLYQKITDFKTKKTEKRTLRYEQIGAKQPSQSDFEDY